MESSNAVDRLAVDFSHAQRTKRGELETSDNSTAIETMRQQLASKYYEDVYLPRQEFWDDFDEFVKEKTPTWINPGFLKPKKAEQTYNKLHVADWEFTRTSLDTLTETKTTVSGLHVLPDVNKYHSLAKQRRRSMGTLALLRTKGTQDNYLANRVQQVNAYKITTTISDKMSNEKKVIQFTGQDSEFDTFIPISQLQQAGRTYTGTSRHSGGIGYFTRYPTFQGTFSAPIECPVELTAGKFAHANLPDTNTLDIEKTDSGYAYLFNETPYASIYGEVDIEDMGLFKTSGNETLAYMQARALFEHITESALVKS